MVKFTGHTITPDSALGGTRIQRSLRFAGAANNSISRTPSSTGNQKVWTWICWFKRTNFGSGSYNYLLSSYGNNDGIAAIYFDSDNRINTYFDTSGSNPYGAVNDRRYRDTSSWMHIVWQVDAINTTQKIWINGVEESLSSSLNPPNFAYTMNQSGQLNTIGGAAWYPSGTGNNSYLAEIHFSDGTKYTPSDFAYTDAQTGQWRPKNGNVVKSNLTYGTNGYWLDFRDNTSTTTLGYDYSGNGNHWTLNNMSVAAGADNDSVTDTPTNNFPILNPLDSEGNAPSDGNLRGGTAGTSGWRHTRSTVPLPSSGKWYWEYKVPDASADASNGWITGIAYSNLGFTQDINSDSTGLYGRQTENKYNNSSSDPTTGSHFTTPSNNDILQFAYDADSQTLFTGRNNTWELSANPSTGANPNWTGVASGGYPMVGSYGSSRYVIINFGQQGFSYTPPTGYRSLSTNNLPPNVPSVIRPEKHFKCLTYTGNDSNDRDITGLEFKPDFVWIKNRGQLDWHMLQDSVRGANKVWFANRSEAQDTDNTNGHVNYFTNDGFNVTAGDSGNVNENNENYVAWCWKAGGDSNTYNIDGRGYATVSAAGLDGGSTNPTGASISTKAGFSIITYTGTGSSTTIEHGLGATPNIVITKSLSASGSPIILDTVGNSTAEYGLFLNDNGGYTSYQGGTYWSDTLPTSSVFTVNSNASTNASGVNYVAYCWTSIPGFSKFGKYTGNGSDNGTFVYTGFRPAWVTVKNTNASNNWQTWDNAREPNNVMQRILEFNDASTADDASSNTAIDFLANGFKHRTSFQRSNTDGGTYIYLAFAEEPGTTPFDTFPNAR